MSTTLDITQILQDRSDRQHEGIAEIYSAVYDQLKALARKQLQQSWSNNTISTTVLVNETYLKLIKSQKLEITNRAHFFAIAATAMRQILINYAEQKKAQKRGGDWLQVTYQETLIQSQHKLETLLAVSEAVEQIRSIDTRLAELIELRFFAGLTESEIAEIFGVNERTLRRNWAKAKMLLAKALGI
ncbi:ECF-type sigma factor [Agarilytica rhodophyticola]|uniref:ECF-type sigma factor n=1 Tax=Agarilytica rhodophyticola TaxID=1737490 RepID=UPI000B344913|nr:ECF-type sigma factor [Agarilytica rhodophyticola]